MTTRMFVFAAATAVALLVPACADDESANPEDESGSSGEESSSGSSSTTGDDSSTGGESTGSGTDATTTDDPGTGGETDGDTDDATTGGEAAFGEFALLEMPEAMDVSADGQHVLLYDGFSETAEGGTGIWHAETGLEMLDSAGQGGLQYSHGISNDGTRAVGTTAFGDEWYPSIWTGEGWSQLGSLGSCGPSHGSSWDLSHDGNTAVGLAWNGCDATAFRWTQEGGMQALESLGLGSNRASAVSADGSIAGGFGDNGLALNRTPALWGPDGSGFFLDESLIGEVNALSDDGTVAGGAIESEAFYWTQEEGVVIVGRLEQGDSDDAAVMDVCAGGEYLIGFSGIAPLNRHAFIWTQQRGMEKLEDRLRELGMEFPDSLSHLWIANACSADGTVLVGAAITDRFEAYRMVLPEQWWTLP